MIRRRIKILTFLGFVLITGMVALFTVPRYMGSILYPLDYRQDIKKYSAQFNLNPNFVCGIIYSESRFNPRAGSHAGARGLMQLMPSTAASIARTLGDNDFTADKLYEPSRNIKYGTYYLKTAFDRYKGNEDLVLMHYNGGPGAVQSFQRNGSLPNETRGYVGKVKSARDIYNQVYGEWWKLEEFNRPTTNTHIPKINNIYEFWRVLISSGEK